MGTCAHQRVPYQPSASCETGTVWGMPAMGRDPWTALRPIVASARKPFSSRAPLPYSFNVKERKRPRPLQRGKPACSPRGTRRKNA